MSSETRGDERWHQWQNAWQAEMAPYPLRELIEMTHISNYMKVIAEWYDMEKQACTQGLCSSDPKLILLGDNAPTMHEEVIFDIMTLGVM